jgi:hypothetical protein
VTVPALAAFASPVTPPSCQTKTIQINTGPLTLANPAIAQNFNANINIQSDKEDPKNLKVNLTGQDEVQIKVTVLPAAVNTSCYLTDSSGNFLSDCDGTLASASGSDVGKFAIVANKKNIEVATNPGQFYFNLVWHNTTGGPQTVNAKFFRTGVLPNGAQALHAAVFSGYLGSLTTTEFDQANSIGKPEGKDDNVTGILVPAGSSLLVTYHLDWAGLGAAVPSGCATTCPTANQLIQVTGQVINATSTAVVGECTAKAYGYRKTN